MIYIALTILALLLLFLDLYFIASLVPIFTISFFLIIFSLLLGFGLSRQAFALAFIFGLFFAITMPELSFILIIALHVILAALGLKAAEKVQPLNNKRSILLISFFIIIAYISGLNLIVDLSRQTNQSLGLDIRTLLTSLISNIFLIVVIRYLINKILRLSSKVFLIKRYER